MILTLNSIVIHLYFDSCTLSNTYVTKTRLIRNYSIIYGGIDLALKVQTFVRQKFVLSLVIEILTSVIPPFDLAVVIARAIIRAYY